jgi:hypothetical protein
MNRTIYVKNWEQWKQFVHACRKLNLSASEVLERLITQWLAQVAPPYPGSEW